MKKNTWAFFCILFLSIRLSGWAQADTVLARYKRYLYNTVQRPDVRALVVSYDKTNQWPDISYKDTLRARWQLERHLERTRDLAIAWSDPHSPFYHDPAFWTVMTGALDNWLKENYRNSNWWHNEIGVPQYMRDILVLVRDTLSPSRLAGALRVMGQYRLQKTGAGANLVWSADLGLHFGLLTGNDSLTRQCAALLANEIRITTGDGVQPDYSFHQHGARLQMYQYGAAFLKENVRLAWQLKGTPWAFPGEKISILADFVLRGWQWMARGINTVPGTIDRSVSRADALHSADLRELTPYLCAICPEKAKYFLAIAARQDDRGDALQGARYFPYSDLFVYQDRHFGFFLKTLSDRTLPSESINGENIKGALLNSGDAYIIKNGNEYFNLMPVWNWKKLPGITSFEGAEKIIRHSFTGSVSDSTDGLTVMEYGMQGQGGQRLNARKYWACHDGLVVCLIAGLEMNGTEKAFTVLDQCREQGNITVDRPGNIISGGEHSFSSIKWIHHAGLAYIFLEPSAVHLQTGPVTGTWQSINASAPGTPVTEQVFTPVMMHPSIKGPVSTGYVMAWCRTAPEAGSLALRPSWRILRNDTACQAVQFRDGKIMCSFYTGGSLVLAGRRTISADKPCLILLTRGMLSVSDPSRKGGTVTVGIDGKARSVQLPADGTTIGITLAFLPFFH